MHPPRLQEHSTKAKCESYASYPAGKLPKKHMLAGLDLTNRKWIGVVCTLIDNDVGHHSGQNVVESRGAAGEKFSEHYIEGIKLDINLVFIGARGIVTLRLPITTKALPLNITSKS